MRQGAGRARWDCEIPPFQRVQKDAHRVAGLRHGRMRSGRPTRRGGRAMNCCNFQFEELKAFVDGELPILRRAAVRAHVSHCPACREEVKVMEQMSNELKAGDIAALPADLRDRLISAAPEGAVADSGPQIPLWRTRLMEIWV